MKKVANLKQKFDNLNQTTRKNKLNNYLSVVIQLVKREAIKKLHEVSPDDLPTILQQADYKDVYKCISEITDLLQFITSDQKSMSGGWELFQVISDLEWAKYKSRSKDQMESYNYHCKNSRFRHLLEGAPYSPSNEELPAKLLISKLSQELNFTLSTDSSSDRIE